MSVLGYTNMLLGAPRTYATWSTTSKSSNIGLSGGNLSFNGASGNFGRGAATIGKSSGKWYWEVTITAKSNTNAMMGILSGALPVAGDSAILGAATTSYGWRGGVSGNGCYSFNSSNIGTGCTAMAAGQVIGFALDLDNHTLAFYVNGVLQTTASSVASTTWYPACGSDSASGTGTANFGQSGFSYTPPAGFNSGIYT